MSMTTISITQGTGTPITADSSAGGDMQVIKLAESALGSTSLVPASASTGLVVNLGTVSAASVPVTNVGGQTLNVAVQGTATVAGTVAISGTPAVSQSGTWNIATVTNITNTVTVAGTVAISGTATITQSGTWNIGTVATITNTVTVAGTVAISGTPTIQGTVTGNQGTAAATAGAWPIKLTDASNVSTLQNVGGVYCLPVKVLAQTGGGYSQQDKTAFTEGTTPVEAIGGVYNDSFAGSPASGQASVLRITAQRAAHVNLRRVDGTEIGTSTTPLVVVGNSSGAMPVSGTVAATQSGSNWSVSVAQIGGSNVATAAAGVQQVAIVGSGGTAISQQAPLQVQNAPSGGTGGATQTPWKSHVALSASQTSVAIHTPASGKTAYIEGIQISISNGSGLLNVYDATNASANMVWAAGVTWAYLVSVVCPQRPIPLSAANNVLRYDTGATVAGDITAWGYDA
jgi:hypothetical protein